MPTDIPLQTYNTYDIPFNADYGFPQTYRLTIYQWVFDITWSFNIISNMPILSIKDTVGNVLAVKQLVPYFAFYTEDFVSGEPFMTIICNDVGLKNNSVCVAINRTWSGAMLSQ